MTKEQAVAKWEEERQRNAMRALGRLSLMAADCIGGMTGERGLPCTMTSSSFPSSCLLPAFPGLCP